MQHNNIIEFEWDLPRESREKTLKDDRLIYCWCIAIQKHSRVLCATTFSLAYRLIIMLFATVQHVEHI